MAKSLGNIVTLEDIVEKGFDLRAFKLLVLSKHYRTEGNFTWEILEAAQNRLNHWLSAADLLWQELGPKDDEDKSHGIMRGDEFNDKLLEILQDDLNTPSAIALVDEVLSDVITGTFCNACLNSILMSIKDMLGIDLLAEKSDITEQQKNF